MANVLVVYFSETEHTARAAREVARRLGGEIDPIVPVVRRQRSALGKVFHALMGHADRVQNSARDPARYGLVIVATPVWAGRLPPPVRGYLARAGGRIRNVGFLVTCGGAGAQRVLRTLRTEVGRAPMAEVTITDADRRTGADLKKLAAFADMLRETRAA